MASKAAKSKTKKPQTATERLIKETNDKNWVYDSKTRGAVNKKTGEKISRRQLDKNYGTLKQQGFSSFEAKAKSRKKAGLTGFKAPPNFKNFSERTFFDRDEMIAYLKTVKPGAYTFRVKLSGKAMADRYSVADDGMQHAYADQLAFEQPDELAEFYNVARYEKKFSEVVAWTLVAKKEKQ